MNFSIVGPTDAPIEPEPVKSEALWVCQSRNADRPGWKCPGFVWAPEG